MVDIGDFANFGARRTTLVDGGDYEDTAVGNVPPEGVSGTCFGGFVYIFSNFLRLCMGDKELHRFSPVCFEQRWRVRTLGFRRAR